MTESDPACVKTHTIANVENTILRQGIEHRARSTIRLHGAQFLRDVSTCAAGAGVFAQPRPDSDIGHPRQRLTGCTVDPIPTDYSPPVRYPAIRPTSDIRSHLPKPQAWHPARAADAGISTHLWPLIFAVGAT